MSKNRLSISRSTWTNLDGKYWSDTILVIFPSDLNQPCCFPRDLWALRHDCCHNLSARCHLIQPNQELKLHHRTSKLCRILNLKKIRLFCTPRLWRFGPQFFFSAVQFAFGWSERHANSGAVIRCNLYAFTMLMMKVGYGTTLQPNSQQLSSTFWIVTDTQAVTFKWFDGSALEAQRGTHRYFLEEWVKIYLLAPIPTQNASRCSSSL